MVGLLAPDARVELIDGEIIDMAPIGLDRNSAVTQLNDLFGRAHPAPADVLLLVEVSDSTLRYDRDVKVPLYARHDIQELWIVDLQNAQVRMHRAPQGGVYLDQESTGNPGLIAIAALSEVAVDLSGVLAPPPA
jgi:Uma2 family endonuclease